jgi:hypothetical protein
VTSGERSRNVQPRGAGRKPRRRSVELRSDRVSGFAHPGGRKDRVASPGPEVVRHWTFGGGSSRLGLRVTPLDSCPVGGVWMRAVGVRERLTRP